MLRPNRWANAARDARNSLVYNFLEPPPPTHEGMYVLAQMTSAIIILILLREVGIPHSRLTRIVQEREPFTWLVEEGPKLMPYLTQHIPEAEGFLCVTYRRPAGMRCTDAQFKRLGAALLTALAWLHDIGRDGQVC